MNSHHYFKRLLTFDNAIEATVMYQRGNEYAAHQGKFLGGWHIVLVGDQKIEVGSGKAERRTQNAEGRRCVSVFTARFGGCLCVCL